MITLGVVFQQVTLHARELAARMSESLRPALESMAAGFTLLNLQMRRRGVRPRRAFVITFAPIAWRHFVDGDTIVVYGPDGRERFARVLWVENGNQLICVYHRFPLWPALKLLWWHERNWLRYDGWRRLARPQDYHVVSPPDIVRLPLWWAHPIEGHDPNIECHDPRWYSPATHIGEALRRFR